MGKFLIVKMSSLNAFVTDVSELLRCIGGMQGLSGSLTENYGVESMSSLPILKFQFESCILT